MKYIKLFESWETAQYMKDMGGGKMNPALSVAEFDDPELNKHVTVLYSDLDFSYIITPKLKNLQASHFDVDELRRNNEVIHASEPNEAIVCTKLMYAYAALGMSDDFMHKVYKKIVSKFQNSGKSFEELQPEMKKFAREWEEDREEKLDDRALKYLGFTPSELGPRKFGLDK